MVSPGRIIVRQAIRPLRGVGAGVGGEGYPHVENAGASQDRQRVLCVQAEQMFKGFCSNFQDFLVFGRGELVDAFHGFVGRFLDLLFGDRQVVLGDLGLSFSCFLTCSIASRRMDADGDLGLLGGFGYELGQILAALLGELRHDQADHLAVVTWV